MRCGKLRPWKSRFEARGSRFARARPLVGTAPKRGALTTPTSRAGTSIFCPSASTSSRTFVCLLSPAYPTTSHRPSTLCSLSSISNRLTSPFSSATSSLALACLPRRPQASFAASSRLPAPCKHTRPHPSSQQHPSHSPVPKAPPRLCCQSSSNRFHAQFTVRRSTRSCPLTLSHNDWRGVVVPVGGADKCRQLVSPGLLHHHV